MITFSEKNEDTSTSKGERDFVPVRCCDAHVEISDRNVSHHIRLAVDGKRLFTSLLIVEDT